MEGQNQICCQCLPSLNYTEVVKEDDSCEHFIGDCSFIDQKPACKCCEFRAPVNNEEELTTKLVCDCGKTCTSKSGLTLHLKSCNPDLINTSPKLKLVAIFCTCGRTCTTQSGYTLHRKSCDGIPPTKVPSIITQIQESFKDFKMPMNATEKRKSIFYHQFKSQYTDRHDVSHGIVGIDYWELSR